MTQEERERFFYDGVECNFHETSETTSAMTINDYQKAALRTAGEPNLINGALGLCGESGEVADIVKKANFQGHPLDVDHIAKELGDVAWYLAVSAKAIGYDLESILIMNIEKLKKRYPEGFEKDRSLHRKSGDV